MGAWMLRGQGTGIVEGRVYLRAPTAEEMGEALARELALHGIDRKGKAKVLWVRRVAVEIVGAKEMTVEPSDPKAPEQVEGRLSDAQVEEILVRMRTDSPKGSGRATGGQMETRGEAMVINPGDVGELKL